MSIIQNLNEFQVKIFGGVAVVLLSVYQLSKFINIQSKQQTTEIQQKQQQLNEKNDENIKNQQIQELNLIKDMRRRYYKICLTGGPCAGKTVGFLEYDFYPNFSYQFIIGLAFLQEKLRERGFNVFIVPEAATTIGTGGGMLNLSSYSEDDIIKFQLNLLKLQMSLEETFEQISQINSGQKKAIILCDRGLMDGKAYMDQQLWNRMIQNYKLNESSLWDRYDAVIHMVTAADGAEKFYCLQNNEARHESRQTAIDIDKKSQEVWKHHPRFEIIDNLKFKSFQEKLENLLNKVNSVVGLPKFGKSIKYLLDTGVMLSLNFPPQFQVQKFEVEDIFLITRRVSVAEKLYQKLQKRIDLGKLQFYWIQTTRENGVKTLTFRRQIDHTEFGMLLEHRDKTRSPVCKLRSCFQLNGVFMVVDTYPYVAEGFSLLKIKEEQELDEDFKFPQFLIRRRNVSTDPGYRTRNLAKKDWFAPQGDEKITHVRKLSNLSDENIISSQL